MEARAEKMCPCGNRRTVGAQGLLCEPHERLIERLLGRRRFDPRELEELRQRVYLELLVALDGVSEVPDDFDRFVAKAARRPIRRYLYAVLRQRALTVTLETQDLRSLRPNAEQCYEWADRGRRYGEALERARNTYCAGPSQADFDKAAFFDAVVYDCGAAFGELGAADYDRLAQRFPRAPQASRVPPAQQGDRYGYLRVRVHTVRRHVQRAMQAMLEMDGPGAVGLRSST